MGAPDGDIGHECGLFDTAGRAHQGVVESKQLVPSAIPFMTSPETIIEVPLQGLSIHNFLLPLHVAVES